jgi:hypothetical protein
MALRRLGMNPDYRVYRSLVEAELEKLTETALQTAREHVCGSAFTLRWMLKLVPGEDLQARE